MLALGTTNISKMLRLRLAICGKFWPFRDSGIGWHDGFSERAPIMVTSLGVLWISISLVEIIWKVRC